MSTEGLIPWQPGQSGNPNGRPKKWVSQLKELGYKKSEVNDCLAVLLSMTEDELKDVSDNPKATIMEKVVSLALQESIKKKTLYNIETLLTRVYGQPKQEIEQEIKMATFEVRFNRPEEGAATDR